MGPVAAGMMVVGISIRAARKDGVDWTKFQLPDGREIGIATTDAKKAEEVARKFLLSEQAAGRAFSDKDQIRLEGVRVAFLNPFDQFPPAKSPWTKHHYDRTWALVALCVGLALYIAMRAIGWVIDGFPVLTLEPRGPHPCSLACQHVAH